MHRRALFGLAAGYFGLHAVPALAATHTVTIKGMAFVPKTLAVRVGDKINFVNQDSAPHTASAGDGAFDTGRLTRGQSKLVTVSKAGTHAYICKVHPMMKGTITAS